MLPVKDLFCRIRQFYFGTSDRPLSAASVDTREAADYVAAIRTQLQQLSAFSGQAPELLSLCLSHTMAALKDKNYRMAGDLSDAGIRLCGVYFFPFLSREAFCRDVLLPLEEKHEFHFFENEEAAKAFRCDRDSTCHLTPYFGRQKSESHYLDGDMDAEFQQAHPVLYRLFLYLGLVLFVGCFVLYYLLSHTIFHKSGSLLLLGYVGTFGVGMGLFSLLMSFIRQYMGHVVTFLALGLGLLCAALPLLLL